MRQWLLQNQIMQLRDMAKRRLSAQRFTGFSIAIAIEVAVPLAQQLLGFGIGADLACSGTDGRQGWCHRGWLLSGERGGNPTAG